jgi:hypothetical protein
MVTSIHVFAINELFLELFLKPNGPNHLSLAMEL